jgi:hypothetical protein
VYKINVKDSISYTIRINIKFYRIMILKNAKRLTRRKRVQLFPIMVQGFHLRAVALQAHVQTETLSYLLKNLLKTQFLPKWLNFTIPLLLVVLLRTLPPVSLV